MHTDMSSSYRWTVLDLGFFLFFVFTRASLCVLGLVIVFCVFPMCYCLVVSTSAVSCLERLVSKVTCYMSSGMLNPTHWLSYSTESQSCWRKSVLIAVCCRVVQRAWVRRTSTCVNIVWTKQHDSSARSLGRGFPSTPSLTASTCLNRDFSRDELSR